MVILMFRKLYLLILFFSTPAISFAVTTPTDFASLLRIFTNIAELLIPLCVGASLLVFFFGLAKFIFRVGGDEKEIANGRHLMIYGILGLFVMVSIWGILSLLISDFGPDFIFGIPQLPVTS